MVSELGPAPLLQAGAGWQSPPAPLQLAVLIVASQQKHEDSHNGKNRVETSHNNPPLLKVSLTLSGNRPETLSRKGPAMVLRRWQMPDDEAGHFFMTGYSFPTPKCGRLPRESFLESRVVPPCAVRRRDGGESEEGKERGNGNERACHQNANMRETRARNGMLFHNEFPFETSKRQRCLPKESF
jgi:hypothetical protein